MPRRAWGVAVRVDGPAPWPAASVAGEGGDVGRAFGSAAAGTSVIAATGSLTIRWFGHAKRQSITLARRSRGVASDNQESLHERGAFGIENGLGHRRDVGALGLTGIVTLTHKGGRPVARRTGRGVVSPRGDIGPGKHRTAFVAASRGAGADAGSAWSSS